MILHISSDRIIYISWDQRDILPYGELEKNLPDFLEKNIWHTAKEILIINWPGSFTNLRILTLALNTYNMLHGFIFAYTSISKIDFYKLLYTQKIISQRYCVMYIGQRKNFWWVDCGTGECKKIHLDTIKEYTDTNSNNRFIDEMVAEWKQTMDELLGAENIVMYTTSIDHEKLVRELMLDLMSTQMLEPNYMIEANIDT